MYAMRFCKGMYVDKSLEAKQKKVIWKLRTGRPQPRVYVIALAKNNDMLEIYHSSMLKQGYYKKKEHSPCIVGLASGYDSAVGLVTSMIEDTYRNTGGYDVKGFLRSQAV